MKIIKKDSMRWRSYKFLSNVSGGMLGLPRTNCTMNMLHIIKALFALVIGSYVGWVIISIVWLVIDIVTINIGVPYVVAMGITCAIAVIVTLSFVFMFVKLFEYSDNAVHDNKICKQIRVE